MRLILLLVAFACAGSFAQSANPLAETRFCGPPARDSHGRIKRSTAVRNAFQRLYPCPSTQKPDGPCDGWAKDHVIPLDCGGCDAVSNMQWLPDPLKSDAGDMPKDRWERGLYCHRVQPMQVDTGGTGGRP